MSKIKLLILLLTSFIIIACTVSHQPSRQFKLNYIGGNEDGLIFSNILHSHLESFGIFNSNSNYQINSSINHEQNLYITNVNKTSDREMIISTISAEIFDQNQNCIIYIYKNKVKQFYVITANINYTSNKKAVEGIKRENAEALSKKLIYSLINLKDDNCDGQRQ